jgi:LPXTG-motif cell wall-anchored protein
MSNRFLPKISGVESLILALICGIGTAIFTPWSIEFDLFALFGLVFLITGVLLLLKKRNRTKDDETKK